MFSEKIKEIRSKHNMTQEDLANKLFVTRNAVSKWETNKGLPSVETLMDISKLFNVSIDELLNETDAKDVITNSSKEISKYKMIISCALIFIIYSIISTIFPLILFEIDPTSPMAYYLFIAPLAHILVSFICFSICKKPLYAIVSSLLAIIPYYIYIAKFTHLELLLWELMYYAIFVIFYLILFKLHSIKKKKVINILKFVFFGLSIATFISFIIKITIDIIQYNPSYSMPLYGMILIDILIFIIPLILFIYLFVMFFNKSK